MKGWIYLSTRAGDQLEYHNNGGHVYVNGYSVSIKSEECSIRFEKYSSLGFKSTLLTSRQAIKIIKLKGFKINVDN